MTKPKRRALSIILTSIWAFFVLTGIAIIPAGLSGGRINIAQVNEVGFIVSFFVLTVFPAFVLVTAFWPYSHGLMSGKKWVVLMWMVAVAVTLTITGSEVFRDIWYLSVADQYSADRAINLGSSASHFLVGTAMVAILLRILPMTEMEGRFSSFIGFYRPLNVTLWCVVVTFLVLVVCAIIHGYFISASDY